MNLKNNGFGGHFLKLFLLVKVEGGVRNKGKVSEFNGLIGMLERSEIDIALADLSLTFTRSEVCIFSTVG